MNRDAIHLPLAVSFKSFFKVGRHYINKHNYPVIDFSNEMKTFDPTPPDWKPSVGFLETMCDLVPSCPLDWEQNEVSVVADGFVESATGLIAIRGRAEMSRVEGT